MMRKKYTCPVCGFDDLEEPPYNAQREPSYEICPCCGFEFGFDDGGQAQSFDSFRLRWIESGAAWFRPELKPNNWDLHKQLKNRGGDSA